MPGFVISCFVSVLGKGAVPESPAVVVGEKCLLKQSEPVWRVDVCAVGEQVADCGVVEGSGDETEGEQSASYGVRGRKSDGWVGGDQAIDDVEQQF